MSEEAKAMGIRLGDLRRGAGMSQAELAEAAGIPVTSLRNWEQGRRLPQLDAAFRLAKAMNITLDDLAGQVFETQQEEERKGKGTGEKKRTRRKQE